MITLRILNAIFAGFPSTHPANLGKINIANLPEILILSATVADSSDRLWDVAVRDELTNRLLDVVVPGELANGILDVVAREESFNGLSPLDANVPEELANGTLGVFVWEGSSNGLWDLVVSEDLANGTLVAVVRDESANGLMVVAGWEELDKGMTGLRLNQFFTRLSFNDAQDQDMEDSVKAQRSHTFYHKCLQAHAGAARPMSK